jgi:hypothetical protein
MDYQEDQLLKLFVFYAMITLRQVAFTKVNY